VRVHLLDVSTCMLPLRLCLKVYVFDKSSDDTVLSYETLSQKKCHLGEVTFGKRTDSSRLQSCT
jgi:hypothetical protein